VITDTTLIVIPAVTTTVAEGATGPDVTVSVSWLDGGYVMHANGRPVTAVRVFDAMGQEVAVRSDAAGRFWIEGAGMYIVQGMLQGSVFASRILHP
jgi:hypothetical protein